MKRHPALRALSADHHHGLVQARRLVRASTPDADPTAAEATGQAFLAFWAAHLTRHFREEEEVLLPAFARYGDPSQDAIVRMLVEHVRIRQLVGDLAQALAAGQPAPATMTALGELLRAHIRHEEDVVFPLLETTMPDAALSALPAALAAYGSAP